MYNIYVVYKCFEGKREAFAERLSKGGYIEKVRNENGCIRYDFYFSEKNENELLLIESWESKEHQQVHIETSHMKEVLAFNKEYVEAVSIGGYETFEL